MQNAKCSEQNKTTECCFVRSECAETRSNMSKACLASSATMFQELKKNAECKMQNAKCRMLNWNFDRSGRLFDVGLGLNLLLHP
jgi:hypothetical protein